MTNAVATLPERPARSVLVDMASRFGMEPQAFEATVRATCMPGNVGREHFAAFLLVAKEYGLNPLTKEIYAFPAKGGGIQPIVSIDGWMNMVNAHPQFDGMEFDDMMEDGKLFAVTCRMFRKDRSRPVSVIEYMAECRRGTDVWKQWPARMLRHKAAIQCARYAFGFSGIMEPDEYERMRDVTPDRPASSGLAARLTGRSAPGFDAGHVERETAALDRPREPTPAHDEDGVIEGETASDDAPEPRDEPGESEDPSIIAARTKGEMAGAQGRPKKAPNEYGPAEADAWIEGWEAGRVPDDGAGQ
jgi:phage recombination protein Bet